MENLELDITPPHIETIITSDGDATAVTAESASSIDGAVAPPQATKKSDKLANKNKEKKVHEEQEREKIGLFNELLQDEDLDATRDFLKQLFRGEAATPFIRKNVLFLSVLVGLMLIYVALGYVMRDQRLRNGELEKDLKDRRYKALLQSSRLSEQTLCSKIEDRLPDSTLQTTTEQVYELRVSD